MWKYLILHNYGRGWSRDLKWHSVSSKNGSNLKHMCLSNEMKRDGRQKKKKWKKPKCMHALFVSVTRFSFWSHFEAVLELYLFSRWTIIIIIVIIVVIIIIIIIISIIIIMTFFFRYNTYQTVHKLIKQLTVRISHSVQLYLKLSLFKKLLLKRSVFILGNWLDFFF